MTKGKFYLATSILFSVFSCTKKEKILGETLFAASDSFKVLEQIEPNKQSVVFSVDNPAPRTGWGTKEDSIVFKAKYNEKVTTNISILGLESGAKRTLKVSAKDLEVSWRGEHEGFDFFRKEKALVSYSIEGVDEVFSTDTIDIVGPQLYRADRNFALPAWSFESYDKRGGPFLQPYGNSPAGNYNLSEVLEIRTPNGRKAYKMESAVVNKNGFLNMGASFLSGDVNKRSFEKYFIKKDNPDCVYFNIYLYSPSIRTATKLVIIIGETDKSEITLANVGESARHDQLKHDRKLMNIPMDFTGWKLFSFRYSDIPFATNKFYGGNGNKINEPMSSSIIDLNIEAEFPGKHYVYLDFPIITYGGPFDPTKLK